MSKKLNSQAGYLVGGRQLGSAAMLAWLGPWLSLRIVSGLLLSMWLLHEVSLPGQPNLKIWWFKAPKRAQAEDSSPLRA